MSNSVGIGIDWASQGKRAPKPKQKPTGKTAPQQTKRAWNSSTKGGKK